MISNVAPTITGLPGNSPIFEDDDITFNVVVSDTASDIDSLEICWDLDGAVDLDSDGDTTNDCQEVGDNLTHSWPTSGIRWITATVTDDDGASASQSVNISVQNLPPRSVIEAITNLTEISEGESVSLSAVNSIDTESDKSNLIYQWGTDHLDTDLDGDKEGDIDYYGINYTMDNMPAGTWEVTLVVIDDNNESAFSTITIVVKELPAGSILESINDNIGSVGTGVLMVLFALVIGLFAFLMFTRKSATIGDDKYQSFDGFSSGAMPPTSQPNDNLFEQATAVPEAQFSTQQTQPATEIASTAPVNEYSPYSAEASHVQQPSAISQPAQLNQGPALPATGLPDGWTQEQWNYYGQQWLDANTAPEPVIQPTTTNTPSTSVSTNMSNLLDDLDF